MITVANRTETSARIKYTFDHKLIPVKEICIHEKTLQIDSKVLEKAETEEELERSENRENRYKMLFPLVCFQRDGMPKRLPISWDSGHFQVNCSVNRLLGGV